ncbi:unnamed protein product [Dovyalis caffra]|uniref:Uncharacterized protein n=1 Tax=Dovyalis caffra TaxID=77055 RepID=A0AAV1RJ84_9ROSI|nr:unnamed protein product [Dovyalis caffra]
MKEYQTPLKEHSRSSSDRKFKASRMKQPQKIAKKSLDGMFTSVTEVVSPEISKESSDFSPISEISDVKQSSQTEEISLLDLNAALSAWTDTFPLSDPIPSSEISTITDESDCIESYGLSKPCGSKIGPVDTWEADVVEKLFKEAKIDQVLNSDIRSKKLLDALTKAVIDYYDTLPQEKDWMVDLVSMKWRIVCLCFLIWSFVVSIIFLFGSGLGRGSSAGGPLPT